MGLFRAVSPQELEDLLSVGRFRPGLNSSEGKWFAECAEHALSWARYGEALEGTLFVVVAAEVAEEAYRTFFRLELLDCIGPAVYVEMHQMRFVTPVRDDSIE